MKIHNIIHFFIQEKHDCKQNKFENSIVNYETLVH